MSRFQTQIIHSLLSLLTVGLVILTFTGCFSDSANVGVSGILTIDGQPIRNALVQFHPADNPEKAKLIGSGISDADGLFTLLVGKKKKQELATGEYLVTVAEAPVPEDILASEDLLAGQAFIAGLEHRPLPVLYQRHVDTPLKVKVVPGKSTYDIKLSASPAPSL